MSAPGGSHVGPLSLAIRVADNDFLIADLWLADSAVPSQIKVILENACNPDHHSNIYYMWPYVLWCALPVSQHKLKISGILARMGKYCMSAVIWHTATWPSIMGVSYNLTDWVPDHQRKFVFKSNLVQVFLYSFGQGKCCHLNTQLFKNLCWYGLKCTVCIKIINIWLSR